MRADSRIKAQARTLLRLSLEADGTVSLARALEVVKAVEANPPKRGLFALLKEYVACLERQIIKTQAVIEHAGALDEASLSALLDALSRRYGRTLRPVVRENPALIAGIRARVGDDVYDANLASRLARLRGSLY